MFFFLVHTNLQVCISISKALHGPKPSTSSMTMGQTIRSQASALHPHRSNGMVVEFYPVSLHSMTSNISLFIKHGVATQSINDFTKLTTKKKRNGSDEERVHKVFAMLEALLLATAPQSSSGIYARRAQHPCPSRSWCR